MDGFRVVRRQEPLRWAGFVVLPVALLIAMAFCSLLLILQEKSPVQAAVVLFQGGFGSVYAFQDTLLKAIPLFLCSLGVSVAFRMRVWNIGAEGQFALGGVGATWAVLMWPDLPMPLMLAAMLLCAGVAGGIWGLIPGFLRVRFGLNEIISTLMMNYIGIEFMRYLVYGPWKDPGSMGFPMTALFPDNALFPFLYENVHAGILVCVLAAVVLAVFLQRTRLGFEISAAGENPRAAMYAHIPYGFLLIFVLSLSGCLAGLAGCVEVSATFNRLQPSFCTGYGYTAIVVAWLSRLRISSIVLFSIFIAGIMVGTDNLQVDMQVPAAFGGIMEGLVLLCVIAGQFFSSYRVVRVASVPREAA